VVGGQIERCARFFYSSYEVIERPFGINFSKEQIAAGAFMGVVGSLIFLVPAIY
jgi:hypothetical protein